MKTASFTIIAFLFSTLGIAQLMYIVNGGNGLKTVDLTTYEVTDLFTVSVSSVGVLTDIAMAPDGTLYGVTGEKKLVEVNFDTESLDFIADLPFDDFYTGLYCDANNVLYTSKSISGDLYQYDLNTGTATITPGNFSTPGDFTFYKGNLVFPGFSGESIEAYDGSQLVRVGCTTLLVWTFVNDFSACGTSTIYAIDQLSNLYRYDLETANSELIANLFSGAGQIYGGTIATEYMASNCTTESLEAVNCSLGMQDQNPYGISVGPNPTKGLLQVDILRPYESFSYTLYTTSGSMVGNGILTTSSIDLSQFPIGLYFLKVTNEQGQSVFQQKLLRE